MVALGSIALWLCIGRSQRMRSVGSKLISFRRTPFLLLLAVVVALTALRTASALFTQPRFLGSALLALFHQAALWRRFLNPPKRACFFGCTRWIVRMASFAKPWVRRSARRTAWTLVTFIRAFALRRPIPTPRRCRPLRC